MKHKRCHIRFRRIGSHGYGLFPRISEAEAARQVRNHSIETAFLIGCEYNLIHRLTHKDQPPL